MRFSKHTQHLALGLCSLGESFYPTGNCSFPLCLVSEVFILETDSLVTKKKTIRFPLWELNSYVS